jgi:DNA-binding transcriptional regulator YiaG
MTPDLLREAGQALYGDLWQSALARDLNVNDRTVRRWVANDSPLPNGLSDEVKQLVKQRGFVLADVLRKFPR